MRVRSFWHFDRTRYVLLDYCLLFVSVVCGFAASPSYRGAIFSGVLLAKGLRFVGYGLPVFMVSGLHLANLHRPTTRVRIVETFIRVLLGLTGGVAGFVIIHAAITYHLIGRYVLALAIACGSGLILGSRIVLGRLAEEKSRGVVLLGRRDSFRMFKRHLAESRLPIRVVAEFDTAEGGARAIQGDSILAFCSQNGVNQVVVDKAATLSAGDRRELMTCTLAGFDVVELDFFFEREFECVNVWNLDDAWFWGYDPAYSQPTYFTFKRMLDIALSTVGLICSLPFGAIIALLIKLQDGGPVLYTQKRSGLHNVTFTIYKFRTMIVDAERDGARWAARSDTRITAFGWLLRRSRLDEIPQFLNILRGDMSFIGPRPERPELVAVLGGEIPYYASRHLIKPGLTGWAQINYPYGASVEDAKRKLSFDLYYLKHARATLDMLIVLRTIVAMIKGAR